ncbi:signal peptidase II [Dyadobacter jejuensis]|uniref:Lipoprotein signal peptidase n=1 Tax=Dyadobacter jejuensis TaxID=1082580 RepID=A0A316ANG3_9BACT|nr:signal peptidase II [Dyadobacter jejuensis]PWJ59031.1 signal peptidase II [Dyadobacter jejuensis]
MKKSDFQNIGIIILLLVNLSCDQISKELARNSIDDHEIIPVIEQYFTLTKVENTGAFLSMGSELPQQVKNIVLSIVPLLTLIFGVFYLFRNTSLSMLSKIALSTAIGGGFGNIYDRLFRGSVTDFMHLNFGFIQSGIFNMADVSIMIGMILFIVQSIFPSKTPLQP